MTQLASTRRENVLTHLFIVRYIREWISWMTNVLWQALKVADDDCPRADDGLARLGLPL